MFRYPFKLSIDISALINTHESDDKNKPLELQTLPTQETTNETKNQNVEGPQNNSPQ